MKLTSNIKQITNGQYKFNIKSQLDNYFLSSEGYATKESCKQGLKTFKMLVLCSDTYHKKISKNGRYFFNVVHPSGLILGISKLFNTQSYMDLIIYNLQNGIIHETETC